MKNLNKEYEKFMKIYDILIEKGYVIKNKPLWDIDVYDILKELK